MSFKLVMQQGLMYLSTFCHGIQAGHQAGPAGRPRLPRNILQTHDRMHTWQHKAHGYMPSKPQARNDCCRVRSGSQVPLLAALRLCRLLPGTLCSPTFSTLKLASYKHSKAWQLRLSKALRRDSDWQAVGCRNVAC